MQDINSKVAEIKSLVENKVLHPYLLQYIEVPFIDEDKLLLLVSAMEELDLTEEERKNYAVTAMLIQIALDTHEHVSNTQSDSGIKERQLTVLAGDYYSGLYYKLLADSDDIGMIRALSRGIKDVNEHKILLYQKEFVSISQLLESVAHIEASLLTSFSDYFRPGILKPLIKSLLLIKRLLKEREDYLKTGISPFFEAIKAIESRNKGNDNLMDAQSLLAKADSRLLQLKSEFEDMLGRMPAINIVLKNRAFQLASDITRTKICVEEG